MLLSIPWSTTDHSIQEFPDFLELIQEMMNEGELEFCGKMEEQSVSILLKEEAPKPLTIFYRGENSKQRKKHLVFLPPYWLLKYQLHFAIRVIKRCHEITRVKR